MNKIVIINGSGTSGKDTVVKMVKENFKRFYNVYNVSSIDKIREAAKILGWSGAKNEKDREFLHNLKILASGYNDHSMCYMLSQITGFKTPFIGFFHIREPQEIEKFKELLSTSKTEVITILVKRELAQKFNNDADASVDEYTYNYIIENNLSLYDLECKVINLFYKILKS